MRVAITGASGFVGSHVLDRMQGLGYQVRCLVRPSRSLDLLHGRGIEVVPVQFSSTSNVAAALDGCDVVIHVAGTIKGRNSADFLTGNVLLAHTVASAATRATPSRLVIISSQAASGPAASWAPATEAQPDSPVSTYGASKLLGERAAFGFADRIEVVAVRPSVVYGPRDAALLPLFRAVELGISPRLPLDPHISIIHARDLARLVALVGTDRRAVGEVFLASAEPSLRFSQLTEIIGGVSGRRPLQIRVPGPALIAAGAAADLISRLTGTVRPFSLQKSREMCRPGWVCSSTKVRSLLGFTAEVSHDEGLRETYAWYRAAGWI